MKMLLRGALMILALSALGSTARAEESPLLVDFPSGAREGAWISVNDDVMGGRSKGTFRLKNRSLLFTGSTNTKGGGFASIRSRPGSLPLDGYDGIRLRVRGDGRTYTFRLTTSDTKNLTRRPSYWAEFETQKGRTWQEVEVPFRAFKPRYRGRWLSGPALNPGAVDSLGLMIYDKQDGAFRLEIDWIRAYRETPVKLLEDLRDEKRVLLVFAPTRKALQFKRQLDLVRQNQAALDDRDVVLITVLVRGESRVGEKRLEPEVAQQLRDRYDIAKDAFAVLCLDRSGSIVSQSDDVAWISGLVVLLDGLPPSPAKAMQPSRPATPRS